MSPLLFLLFTLLVALLVSASPIPRSTTDAAQWFTVEWDAPEFTAMSGDFIVPNVPQQGGVPIVWPGLQGDNGVLQAELNGQTGTWSLGNNFYGTPALPLDSSFSVSPGETVHFSFTQIEDTGLWLGTLSGPHTSTGTFAIPGNTLNRAILAVDLAGVPHDFAVIYSDVVITASTPASQWCSSIASSGYDGGSASYTVNDAVAESNTCRIGEIILPGTA